VSFGSVLVEVGAALGDEETDQRQRLQRLDASLRRVAGLDPRPYSLVLAHGEEPRLTYAGPPLSVEQEDEVRRYVDFVRQR
jgi:hypothetical protein